MPAKPIKAKEQYRLVMECRSSGLTDHQLCREKDICPALSDTSPPFLETAHPTFPVPAMELFVAGTVLRIPNRTDPVLVLHSYAFSSAVAWAMYQKYVNSMSLYCQEQDWKQMGVTLSRVTFANWIIYCVGNYFSPLYDYFHRKHNHI